MRSGTSNRVEDGEGARSRMSEVLARWSGIEPRADFEAQVWRQIRGESGKKAPSVFSFWSLNRMPAIWTNALAASLGIAVGIAAGLTGLAARYSSHADESLLNRETVAGSYLAMMTGGRR